MTALQQMAQFLKENGHTELAQKAQELLELERSQIREAYEQGCFDTEGDFINKNRYESASAQYYDDTFIPSLSNEDLDMAKFDAKKKYIAKVQTHYTESDIKVTTKKIKELQKQARLSTNAQELLYLNMQIKEMKYLLLDQRRYCF